MRPVKGIYHCSDIELTASNDHKESIELSPDHPQWSGLLYLTCWAKEGALGLTLGEDEEAVSVDSFSGYSAVIDARAVSEIALESTNDAVARVLIEII